MNRVMVTALLALLAGCKPKLAGTYHGDAQQTGWLTGPRAFSNSSLNDSSVADVGVSESGDTITVDFRACHFEAKRTKPTQAIATSIDCPIAMQADVTFHVSNAVLDFEGEKLSWSWMGTATKGDASGFFTSRFSGTRK